MIRVAITGTHFEVPDADVPGLELALAAPGAFRSDLLCPAECRGSARRALRQFTLGRGREMTSPGLTQEALLAHLLALESLASAALYGPGRPPYLKVSRRP